MGLVRRSLPMEKVRRWLATPAGRVFGYPAAAGFGAVTPFCSCSSVPLFIGFVEAGIPIGVTFAFLITSPLVNEIVVALFVASFGWRVAVLYTVCGIALGIAGGWFMHAVRAERWLSEFARGLRGPGGAPACCGGEGGAGAAPAAGSGCCGCAGGKRGPSAAAFASREAWRIYTQVLPYLAAALVVGAVIHGFVPDDFFVEFFRSGAVWHVPAAVVIGFPLYASANATVPILETLVAKGVPLGTGMAFIMSVVGVSLPELIILRRVMTVRLLALFTAVVCAGVALVGFLFNALPASWW
jgi:hypothetical protein